MGGLAKGRGIRAATGSGSGNGAGSNSGVIEKLWIVSETALGAEKPIEAVAVEIALANTQAEDTEINKSGKTFSYTVTEQKNIAVNDKYVLDMIISDLSGSDITADIVLHMSAELKCGDKVIARCVEHTFGINPRTAEVVQAELTNVLSKNLTVKSGDVLTLDVKFWFFKEGGFLYSIQIYSGGNYETVFVRNGNNIVAATNVYDGTEDGRMSQSVINENFKKKDAELQAAVGTKNKTIVASYVANSAGALPNPGSATYKQALVLTALDATTTLGTIYEWKLVSGSYYWVAKQEQIEQGDIVKIVDGESYVCTLATPSYTGGIIQPVTDVSGKEDKVNKITAITAESTDTQYPSAKAVHTELARLQEEIDTTSIYGVEFDYTTAAGTRLFAAANLNFTPSTDVTEGTDDFKDTPCFEAYNCLVKYDGVTQKAKVVAVEGSLDYDTYKTTAGYNVVRMFKKFYYKIESTANKLRVLISANQRQGWAISPMHYRGGKVYEWIGITVYPWGIEPSDVTVVASRSGLNPKTNISENACEVLARAAGMRMFGLKEVATLQILGLVKYANLNWQSFIGQGNTGGVKETKASVAQTDATSVIVANTNVPANLSEVWTKCCVMVNGTWYKILSVEAYDTDNTQINIDGTVTTTTNSNVYLGLFFSGATDAVKGDDGYDTDGGNITTTTRRAMKNLGLEQIIGNQGERLGGGCSIVTVADNVSKASVYINPDPDGDYVFPNASNDKEWDKVTEALATANGNNRKFILSADLIIPILLPSNDSGNKTDDYTYATANAGVYSIFFGGGANGGADAGGFCSSWSAGVDGSRWYFGFRGVYVPL